MCSGTPVIEETAFLSRRNKILDMFLRAKSKFVYESDVEYRQKETQNIIYRQCEKNHKARSTNKGVPVVASLGVLAAGNVGLVKP